MTTHFKPMAVGICCLGLIALGCNKSSDNHVVVYCAQDDAFAVPLFDQFRAANQFDVVPKFDTEANKSVGLATALEQEADRPRCDIHWNNEILATIRLARLGVYEPYRSPSAAGYPDWTTSPDGLWQAFAARARVAIVNTTLVPPADYPQSILDLTDPKWQGKLAMAKPQFGTTATQAACLFDVLGASAAEQFYRGLKANGVQIVAGNKQVAAEVSAGRVALGLTDTDDALLEMNAGKPVAILFLDRAGHPLHPKLGTLYIPNTLAVVKNGPNPVAARQLVDELLRPETEARLATAGGFQIPLHPDVVVELPKSIMTPTQVHAMQVNFHRAADLWESSQAFLRDEFAR